MNKDPFKEYIIESNPTKKELGYSWYTAIGLQKVDGLETSGYLKRIAIDNIEGEISIDKAEELIKSYYDESEGHSLRTEEADIVSINTAKILSEKAFVFSSAQYLEIHRRLFSNVFNHAGKIRTYNITKKEWVLDGDTILYGSASLLNETLEYDFNVEKAFDYSKLNIDEFIHHIARFIADLWQIHVFSEGNTRTTAVFLIKYLRKFGFDITNDIFAKNAWHFRNALVRANYSNIEKRIYETTEYLELFLRNLLLKENNELKNRYLHIGLSRKVDIETEKVDIGAEKVDIGAKKVDIEAEKVNFESIKLTSKLRKNILFLYSKLSKKEYFGRNEIMEVLKMSPSGASKLISKLIEYKVIIPTANRGKGKYIFNIKGVSYE